MTNRILLSIYFILSFGMLNAQVFTLPMVMDSVIQKNFNVQIAGLESEIAQNRNTMGYAGAYPSLSLFANESASLYNTRQEFFTGDVRAQKNALSTNTTVSARADWFFFQGFAVKGKKEELTALANLGEIGAQQKMENELLSAASIFYEIIWRQELINTLREATQLSRERKTLAEQKFKIGSGNRLEQLQSSSDLNADSSVLLQQINAVLMLKAELAVLMGREPVKDFAVEGTMETQNPKDLKSLEDEALQQNFAVLSRKAELSRNFALYKQGKSQLYPALGAFGEYNFTQSQNQVGILKSNRNVGPAFGLTLSYNLFNGFITRTDIKNAKLNNKVAHLSLEQTRLEVKSQLVREYANLLMQHRLIKLEEESEEMAKENLQIAKERLRIGVINDLQFREIQQLYTQASSRLINARYLARISQLNIWFLTGNLLKSLKEE